MPANRGQRRPQLVRDRHQEVAFELLCLGDPGRHLPEALGEVGDLTAASNRRDVHVTASLSDLVHGLRERQDRLGDPAREVEREYADDDEADEERDRETREQRDPGLPELSLRLGHDEDRERHALGAAELDRIGRSEVRPVLARRLELEGHDPVGAQLDSHIRACQPRQT